MDAVSYPNEKVINFINDSLAPVRVNISSQPLPKQFNAHWTPTFVILDREGEEHYRAVGFLPPNDLIAMLLLGIAKSHFDHENYDQALSYLNRILKEHPDSDFAPEAVYFRGVTRYRQTDDLREMKHAYRTLKDQHERSEWTKRASVYDRLEQ